MQKGTYKHTEKTLEKMRQRRHSSATKSKMAISKKGKPRPDLIGNKIRLGSVASLETKEKMSSTHKLIGNKPPSWEGKKHTEEWRKSQSERQCGEKSIFWLGGITKETAKARNCIEYKLWREKVYQRDNFKCVQCGYTGKHLNADHIKSFSKHIELRFDINNGRTLCISCHKNTPNYAGRANKLDPNITITKNGVPLPDGR